MLPWCSRSWSGHAAARKQPIALPAPITGCMYIETMSLPAIKTNLKQLKSQEVSVAKGVLQVAAVQGNSRTMRLVTLLLSKHESIAGARALTVAPQHRQAPFELRMLSVHSEIFVPVRILQGHGEVPHCLGPQLTAGAERRALQHWEVKGLRLGPVPGAKVEQTVCGLAHRQAHTCGCQRTERTGPLRHTGYTHEQLTASAGRR